MANEIEVTPCVVLVKVMLMCCLFLGGTIKLSFPSESRRSFYYLCYIALKFFIQVEALHQSMEQQLRPLVNPYRGDAAEMFGNVWKRYATIKCKDAWLQDVVRMYIEYLDGVPYSRVPTTCEYLEKDSHEYPLLWQVFDKISEGEGIASRIMLDLYRRGSAIHLGVCRLGRLVRRPKWVITTVKQVWRDGCTVNLESADIQRRVCGEGFYKNRVGVLNEILVRLDMFRCDPSRRALLGAGRYCDSSKGLRESAIKAMKKWWNGEDIDFNAQDIMTDENMDHDCPYERKLHLPKFANRIYVDVGSYKGRDEEIFNLSASFEYLRKVSALRDSICMAIALAVEAGIRSHYDSINTVAHEGYLILGKYVAAKALVLMAGSLDDSTRYGDKNLNISTRLVNEEWLVKRFYPKQSVRKCIRNLTEVTFDDEEEEYCARKIMKSIDDGYGIDLVDDDVAKTVCIVAAAMQIDFGMYTKNRVVLLNRDVITRVIITVSASAECRISAP